LNLGLNVTSNEIRRKFLEYFAARGHRIVKSSSLVPANDPTLLFTNAGMNQFKDVFLGLEQRDYQRATTSQKCVRAGGKHNDLENVGRTRRHHTFFEMLGNFSFGDYFKKHAVEYAWELVTREYGLPIDKLYVTVFGGGEITPGAHIAADEEARGFWKEVGVSPDRIFDGSVKDNFWSMGETGPCGPCSEIHIDLGVETSDEGHTDCKFGCECGRYVELWNLVFMQFNRDASGSLTPLPRPSIDTGAGLERMAAVLQGKTSNFETDLLRPLIDEAAKIANVEYGANSENDVSLRIIGDHSRAATFLIHDGILPSNEGRGYVLRKILRRAIRHGKMLGMDRPFLYEMTGKVAELMEEPYPELSESLERVAAVVKAEEQRFASTITIAMSEFDKVAKDATDQAKGARVVLPGDKLFKLYDTFGMPLDWIREIADERDLGVDEAGFDTEMQRQKERARASWKGAGKEVLSPAYAEVQKAGRTKFEGYQQTTSHDCKVVAILVTANKESKPVDEIPAGTKAEIILDHTPFYAESGGQVGDKGVLIAEGSQEDAAKVEDTYSPVSGLTSHRVVSKSPIRVGQLMTAIVDVETRDATRRNHTATHLLHASLRQVLGTHVKQAGSVVDPGRLRFDFAHFTALADAEIEEIESLVNAEILKNEPVSTDVMELDQAIQTGAMAFFGEKYQDQVRVVSVPGFSKELCGGTHVRRTGDIGLIKITSESGISAGVRRIEAVTGAGALRDFQNVTSVVRKLSESLKTSPADLPQAVERLADSERDLQKQTETLKYKMAQAQVADAESQAKTVKDIKVLSLRLESLDRGQMRSIADVLRQRLKSGVVVIGSVTDDKVAIISAITPDLTKRLHAGKIAQAVAQKLGGTGGGRPDMAEAGGKNATLLDAVLNEVYEIVGTML
jgi:alanyl-tRNA synthetase